VGKFFNHWTTVIGQWVGHPIGLAVIAAYASCWAVVSPATFEWNAVATLAVWVMTIFIQRSSRRDTLAIHAKLDELLRSHEQARSELAQLDEEEPEDIEEHRRSERRRD